MHSGAATKPREPVARAIVRGLVWLAPLAPAVCFYAAVIVRSDFVFRGRTYFTLLDDSMISMVYARGLVEGGGLDWPFGKGEVEGYSNLLWTLWMSVLHLLSLPESKVSLLVMVSAALLLLANAVLIRMITAMLAPRSRWLPPLAMLLTALYYPLAFWALGGMEVALLTLLISAAVLLALRWAERPAPGIVWALAGVMALALLTRDDALVPCAVIALWAVLRTPRSDRARVGAVLAGAVLVTAAGHAAFRLAYYGDALPNTYYLKLTGIPLADRLERGFVATLAYTWVTHLYAPLLFAAFYALRRRPPVTSGFGLLAALFLAVSAYSIWVGGDYFETEQIANRYVAVSAPLLLVAAMLGAAELARLTGAVRRRSSWALAAAFGAVAVVLANDWLPTESIGIVGNPGGDEVLRPAIAAAAALGLALLPFAAEAYERGSRGRHRRPRGASALATVALGAVVLVCVNAKALKHWAGENVEAWDVTTGFARLGLALREATPEGTTVAVVAAGASTYFSQRPTVDLLGKADSVVARGPAREQDPRPGHQKWSYTYSVGRLRPEVIAQLWYPSRALRCRLERWGYRPVTPGVYVRRGSPSAKDAPRLRAVQLTRPGPLPRDPCRP